MFPKNLKNNIQYNLVHILQFKTNFKFEHKTQLSLKSCSKSFIGTAPEFYSPTVY